MASRPRVIRAITLMLLLSSCSPEAREAARRTAWVEDQLSSMSLRAKVSQLIFLESDALTLLAADSEMNADQVGELVLGGLIFENGDPFHLAAAVSKFSSVADTPMLFIRKTESVSTEIGSFLFEIPHLEALESANDLNLSRRVGLVVARHTKAIGAHGVLLSLAQPKLSRKTKRAMRHYSAFARGAAELSVSVFPPATLRPENMAIGDSSSVPSASATQTSTFQSVVGALTIVPFPESDSLLIPLLLSGSAAFRVSARPTIVRDHILRLLRAGELREEHVEASVKAILKLKAKHIASPRPGGSISAIQFEREREENRAVMSEVARKSLVVLKHSMPGSERESVDQPNLVILVDDIRQARILRQSQLKVNYEIDSLFIYTPFDYDAILDEFSGSYLEQSSRIILHDTRSAPHSSDSFIRDFAAVLNQRNVPLDMAILGDGSVDIQIPVSVGTVIVGFGPGTINVSAATSALLGNSGVCGRAPFWLVKESASKTDDCLSQIRPRIGFAEEAGMANDGLVELRSILRRAIADSAFPGAAIAVGRNDVISVLEAHGRHTFGATPDVNSDSVFDLASLTKVIATTTAVMQLYEQQQLNLSDPVSDYFPEFAVNDKGSITIRDLLTHTSGLIPFRPLYQDGLHSPSAVVSRILADSLVYEPGTESRYSDFGFIVLALIVEQLSDLPFATYATERIFRPLGMFNTGYRSASLLIDPNVVPTEVDEYYRNTLVQGFVHDENAFILGGTAGHAGLFSTVRDLTKFAHMMINEGRVGNLQFLKPETIRLFTSRVSPDYSHTRALGWDTKSQWGYSSAGRFFGRQSFGHTGFTGTSIWFDPDQALYVILLTNRVYPTRDNRKHRPIRPAVADVVFSSIRTRPSPNHYQEAE